MVIVRSLLSDLVQSDPHYGFDTDKSEPQLAHTIRKESSGPHSPTIFSSTSSPMLIFGDYIREHCGFTDLLTYAKQTSSL